MPKLKVFRTPIGFHDAYVAASSQKVALKAWGSDADLFARGIAEVVTDEALTAEPLASPGKVVRRLRGTADEQLEAARMPDRPKARGAKGEENEEAAPRKRTGSGKRQKVRAEPVAEPPPPPLPQPSRAALNAAEKAMEEAQARHAVEDRHWRERQDALTQERRRLDAAHGEVERRLSEDEDRERRAYEDALRRWQAQR